MALEINLSLITGYGWLFIGLSVFVWDQIKKYYWYKTRSDSRIRIWIQPTLYGVFSLFFILVGSLLVLGSL